MKHWPRILQAVAEHWPIERWGAVGVVIGCSGGADSVALSIALSELRQQGPSPPKGFLALAHFHHGMRGAEADEDERFVRGLAERLGHPLLVDRSTSGRFDENSMREDRLAFLRRAAQQTGARYVSLAQSADDNVETVLHRLFRGTGPAGLGGIPTFRDLGPDLVLARPFLQLRRESIREGLRELGQPWREDSSNLDPRYRRNWIRGELLPRIEDRYPQAADAVLRLIESVGTWREEMDASAAAWLRRQPSARPGRLEFRRGDDVAEPIVIAGLQRAWSRAGWGTGEMTAEHWKRLAETVRSQRDERYSLPGALDVNAERGRCHIHETSIRGSSVPGVEPESV